MQAGKWFGLGAVIVALAMIAMAQQPAPSQEKVIKHIPVKQTSAASGQEMFTSYCAACHGTDGKGAGPTASALKVVPTDLVDSPRRTEASTRRSMFLACCVAKRRQPPTAAGTCRYEDRCLET
jgi:mono/diheme cytochrome c family protein